MKTKKRYQVLRLRRAARKKTMKKGHDDQGYATRSPRLETNF